MRPLILLVCASTAPSAFSGNTYAASLDGRTADASVALRPSTDAGRCHAERASGNGRSVLATGAATLGGVLGMGVALEVVQARSNDSYTRVLDGVWMLPLGAVVGGLIGGFSGRGVAARVEPPMPCVSLPEAPSSRSN